MQQIFLKTKGFSTSFLEQNIPLFEELHWDRFPDVFNYCTCCAPFKILEKINQWQNRVALTIDIRKQIRKPVEIQSIDESVLAV